MIEEEKVVEEVKEEEPKEKKARKKASKKDSAEVPEKKAEEKKDERTEEEKKKDLEEKRKKLIEKAKKFAEAMPIIKIEKPAEKKERKERREEELNLEKSANMLVPLEDYVKSGIYLGTRVITPDMKPYVFKRRQDGLAIINTRWVDEKLRMAAAFLSEFPTNKIVVACKREAGWKALEAFSKVTGIRVFTKKYPAGIITNTRLPVFFEPELAFIVDPWLDKNLLADATLINIPVVSLCDTNNLTSDIDLIVPCNNKSNKSIGIVFWILAREFIKAKGLDVKLPDLIEFTGEKE